MMKRERLLLLLSALLLALFTGIGCRSGQAEAPAPPETEEQVITVRPETTEEEKKPESAPEAETSETSEEPEEPEESAPPAHEGIWTPSELENTLGGADPIEGFNRAMFSCTDFIMNYFVDPVGRVYTSILPRPVIEKFNNLCVNLEFPARAFSCLFRAEWQGAGDETARFLINTTLGIAGLFDPAAHWFDFYSTESDFGQTFAAWGIGPGCTLILPLMSTLNVRATVATYAGVMDELRRAYARIPQAKEAGWKAGDFSYNTGRLRCSECDSTGQITMDVQFLPDVEITCPVCGGSRYSETAERIKRTPKGADAADARSLPELLALTVDEALAQTKDLKKAHERL